MIPPSDFINKSRRIVITEYNNRMDSWTTDINFVCILSYMNSFNMDIVSLEYHLQHQRHEILYLFLLEYLEINVYCHLSVRWVVLFLLYTNVTVFSLNFPVFANSPTWRNLVLCCPLQSFQHYGTLITTFIAVCEPFLSKYSFNIFIWQSCFCFCHPGVLTM